MISRCEYCGGEGEHTSKCGGCGEPFITPAAADYRLCSHCRRKLLSLASRACNYCGQSLPEAYITAREAQLRRINEINPPPKKDPDETRDDDFDLLMTF